MYFYLLIPDELPTEIESWFNEILLGLPKRAKSAKWFFTSQILGQLIGESLQIKDICLVPSMQRIVTRISHRLIGVSEKELEAASEDVAHELNSAELLDVLPDREAPGNDEEEWYEDEY